MSVAVANAQTGPTDYDLFAAYCMGVMQRRLETDRYWEAKCEWGRDEKLCYVTRQSIARGEEERARVRDYLQIRGYLSNGLIAETQRGLTLANRNGYRDTAQCEVWNEEKRQFTLDRCGHIQSADAFGACVQSLKPEVCRQQLRCNDLSQLPM
jgi:hypothetical protein